MCIEEKGHKGTETCDLHLLCTGLCKSTQKLNELGKCPQQDVSCAFQGCMICHPLLHMCGCCVVLCRIQTNMPMLKLLKFHFLRRFSKANSYSGNTRPLKLQWPILIAKGKWALSFPGGGVGVFPRGFFFHDLFSSPRNSRGWTLIAQGTHKKWHAVPQSAFRPCSIRLDACQNTHMGKKIRNGCKENIF